MIITISRQYGAGGSVVARLVAEQLGWRVVDNELVDRVASRAGLSADEVARKEERAPGFVERLARALSRSAPESFPAAADKVPEPEEATLVKVTESVVGEIAAEGRVVMVGRAGSAVLSGKHAALHVKVVAPVAYRVRVAIERLGIDPEDAERVLRDTDENRARYLRQYYHTDWNDPTTYHMVLNTAALGLDGTAELLVAHARVRWAISSP